MTIIYIRGTEHIREKTVFETTVSFDFGEEYRLILENPFEARQENVLKWYFEDWLTFPFINEEGAKAAAASLKGYGESLFNQIFADRNAYSRYKQANLDDLRIEIAGPPLFHQLHWEAIKDPDLPQPLCLRIPLVRKNLTPSPLINTGTNKSPTINLLIVTARPGEHEDVAYRTISRPLVEHLRKARIPVMIDILRPGTYEALSKHLENVKDEHGSGYYHIIHFDVHGGLLDYKAFQNTLTKIAGSESLVYRYGLSPIEQYEGLKAFLYFESDTFNQAVPIEATQLAELLMVHQISMIVLNACQSAKQLGASETSLASRLMLAGVQTVVGMAYSVTVSAAERLMRVVYQQLFEHALLPNAHLQGQALHFTFKTYFNNLQ